MALPTLCQKLRFSRATIRGDTPNSTRSDNNIENAIRPIALNDPLTLGNVFFGPKIINRSRPQPTDTPVCVANNLAAMPPACAGVGRWANNIGTTRKPSVVRLPHQRAATTSARRSFTVIEMIRCRKPPRLRTDGYRQAPALQPCRPPPCQSTLARWGWRC